MFWCLHRNALTEVFGRMWLARDPQRGHIALAIGSVSVLIVGFIISGCIKALP